MKGVEHLRESLDHAEKAAETFPDGSREESVAENAVAWTNRALEIVEREAADSDSD